jgi:hypothetical protein
VVDDPVAACKNAVTRSHKNVELLGAQNPGRGTRVYCGLAP